MCEFRVLNCESNIIDCLFESRWEGAPPYIEKTMWLVLISHDILVSRD
jgi:hypothetical protein